MFDFSKLEFITDKKDTANLQEITDVENEFKLTNEDYLYVDKKYFIEILYNYAPYQFL
ncbi:hypothetical protein [Clostridium sp. C2-6-12]|uniref:hypothetical protein n=1 Tax=Clostridium sp. C2-6-12 TaxID=2698832 RepID=UPI001FAC81D8|nr:hypothetical protein [Clostridium sp. C2-6-12]